MVLHDIYLLEIDTLCGVVVFFFKQRTVFEFRLSLVGSEMCIRYGPGFYRRGTFRATSVKSRPSRMSPYAPVRLRRAGRGAGRREEACIQWMQPP